MRWLACTGLLVGCAFRHGALDPPEGDGSVQDVIDSASDAVLDAFVPPTCSNDMKDPDETDKDCGGSCPQCAVGKMCSASTDCLASVCGTGGTCRRAYSCGELHLGQPALPDGAYSIDAAPTNGSATPVTTFCDMTTDGGGWTLVGKVDGRFDMYNTWLITNLNTASMTTPTIGTGGAASINAVELAVNRSTEMRFSNSARDRWVKWPLPASRAAGTFWHHSVGQTTINAVSQSSVTVTGWDGRMGTCYQNQYGISPWDTHGGAFPGTARDVEGRTLANDVCMMIGTQTMGTVDGFTSNGNQFDTPSDETTWPNTAYNVDPHAAVWLR